MTCFCGPAVDSSFSVMNNILDDKSTRMGVDTYSAIQTVKYALHSTGKPAVECFARKDVKHTPVNHRMCCLMSGAAAAYKGKLKKAREERDEKQAAMSRQHQAEISRLQLKVLNAEAEKQAKTSLQESCNRPASGEVRVEVKIHQPRKQELDSCLSLVVHNVYIEYIVVFPCNYHQLLNLV